MDEFPGLLSREFGFKTQGKSAPMAGSRTYNTAAAFNTGIGSDVGPRSSSSSSSSITSNRKKSDGSSLDDQNGLFGSTGNPKTREFGGLGDYSDVFGGPPKYRNAADVSIGGSSSASSSSNYDSGFGGLKDSGVKFSSLPVYDKPVYDDDDDDLFDGDSISKNSNSSVKYEDLFSSISSPRSRNAASYGEFLEDLGTSRMKKDSMSSSSGKKPGEVDKNVSDFDDLLPGFGGSNPRNSNRTIPEASQLQQQTVPSMRSAENVTSKPFVVLERSSSPEYASSGISNDSIKQINEPIDSGSKISDDPSGGGGVNGDMDPLDGFASEPFFSSDLKSKGEGKNPLWAGTTMNNIEPKSTREVMSRKPIKKLEVADDVWLTVSEIPLFTQPTSVPPPSRIPPRPGLVSEANYSFSAAPKWANGFSSSQYSTESMTIDSDTVKSSGLTPIDDLVNFATGRAQNNANEQSIVHSSEDESDINSASAASAAVLKELNRAEAKIKHGREVRERGTSKASRHREATQQERDGTVKESEVQETEEKQQVLNRKQEQIEKEEKEREQRKLETEKREREKARQAVDRATKEARDRAAAEAHLKAQRAAVERVHAEARGRSAAAAKDRVERAAAEARERENSEAREKAENEARERASIATAEAERLRTERATVNRITEEARKRAAAAAVAANTAVRDNQQTANDFESFFDMGARPKGVSSSRANTPDSIFEAQFHNREGPEGSRWTPPNVANDVTSVFGGTPSTGEFWNSNGVRDERLEAKQKQQRLAQERMDNALAEKNKRDLQYQLEQEERHRLAETIDAEIKRWAAGKDGNLRALLSTLQYVLWSESGWQPVSLIDLITPAAVKKAYRKANLCVHPDKVQQRGATIQQKYIAEKVFDLLQEAWNKLNAEELF